MRIAALSDIHGNLAALEAVLSDVAGREIDVIVNLGDIVSGPLWPAETATRLMALDLPTIAGNHERQLLTQAPDAMNASDAFAAARTDVKAKAWLAGLPPRMALCHDVLMVHGTPTSDIEHLLETIAPEGRRAASEGEVAARLGDTPAGLVLCGHSHVPRAIRLADGRLVVNPGSVGLQAFADDHPWPYIVEVGDPKARYAVLDDAGGRWSAEPIALDYDCHRAADRAAANGREDWARALRTGRL